MEVENQQQSFALEDQANQPQPANLAFDDPAGKQTDIGSIHFCIHFCFCTLCVAMLWLYQDLHNLNLFDFTQDASQVQQRHLLRQRSASPSASVLGSSASDHSARLQSEFWLTEAEALAAYKLQEEAKKAADWRHQRQRSTADHQAVKKQKEEEAEAIRAVARAEVAAAKRMRAGATAKKARKQGKAPLACRAGPPKAASQGPTHTSSGSNSSRQQGPAVPSTPPKKATRPQPSSSSSQTSSLEAETTTFCRCCYITSTPTWRKGHLPPIVGMTICNACGTWEFRHGSVVNSDKVDRHKEAFLAQQAQGCQAAEGVPMEVEPGQGGQEGQVADEQQGSAVQNIAGVGSHTTGLPAAATATAGQEVAPLQRYSLRICGRRQHLQQAQLGGDDEGSGTEAGPKARRKR
ncbi:hypothetical protein ABBQ32_003556 [Trebouxia sp. C0010 RCD-2024]